MLLKMISGQRQNDTLYDRTTMLSSLIQTKSSYKQQNDRSYMTALNRLYLYVPSAGCSIYLHP